MSILRNIIKTIYCKLIHDIVIILIILYLESIYKKTKLKRHIMQQFFAS